MVINNDAPSFVWTARPDTLDFKELSTINPNVTISKYLDKTSEVEILRYVIPEIVNYINEAIEKDKNAKFILYVDDFFYWIEFPIFIENNIPENLYNIIMYTDGTMTYHTNYEIMQENSYDFFLSEKDRYFNTIKKVRNGEENIINAINIRFSYLKPQNSLNTFDLNYIWISTLRNNVEYNLQYPDLLQFQDSNVSSDMKNANIQKLSPIDKFEYLSEEDKEQLYKLLKVDKTNLDNLLISFNDKQTLIITGANPFYGTYSEDEFKNMMNQIYNLYEEDYNIVYKPHPRAVPNDQQEEYLSSYGIKILPASIPLEVIGFIYNDIKLGGFPSSLYMSFERENTLFFFESSRNKLVEPLDIIYNELPLDLKLIQPQDKEDPE